MVYSKIHESINRMDNNRTVEIEEREDIRVSLEDNLQQVKQNVRKNQAL